MPDNGDNLSIQEKLILHQTKKMEMHLKSLQAAVHELTKAVTAGNVIDKLAHFAGQQPAMKAIAEKEDDSWKSL